jgi:hypothetical protein
VASHIRHHKIWCILQRLQSHFSEKFQNYSFSSEMQTIAIDGRIVLPQLANALMVACVIKL